MTELTFTLKDLIIFGAIIVPAMTGILYMKWKQNVLESRINKVEEKHDDFKKHIYSKLDENCANLHRIELSIANLKTEFLQIILEALAKIK